MSKRKKDPLGGSRSSLREKISKGSSGGGEDDEAYSLREEEDADRFAAFGQFDSDDEKASTGKKRGRKGSVRADGDGGDDDDGGGADEEGDQEADENEGDREDLDFDEVASDDEEPTEGGEDVIISSVPPFFLLFSSSHIPTLRLHPNLRNIPQTIQKKKMRE
jgi:hypothetical protein